MWCFDDRAGRRWEIVPGRASWGAHVALFVPAGHDGPVRQAMLDGSAWDQAMAEIEKLGPAGWQGLLDRSTIRDEAS